MHRAVILLEKLALVIITLAVAAYFLLLINEAIFDYRGILFRTGDVYNYLLIGGFMLLLSYVIKKLLLWQVHAAFGRRRRR